MDRSIEEVVKTLDKIVVSPEKLAHWIDAVETTAKNICNDKSSQIKFKYDADNRSMKFYLKDAKSRDCLVKSIKSHLPMIPESLQGFFSVLKYNLKYAKFDK